MPKGNAPPNMYNVTGFIGVTTFGAYEASLVYTDPSMDGRRVSDYRPTVHRTLWGARRSSKRLAKNFNRDTESGRCRKGRTT